MDKAIDSGEKVWKSVYDGRSWSLLTVTTMMLA